jgi:K+-sensing histidine kinase KdpD
MSAGGAPILTLALKRRRHGWTGVAAAVVIVGVETVVSWVLLGQRLADIVMVFLLGVVAMAVGFGYAASLTATVLSVLALDYFFTEPYLSFVIADAHYLLTLTIMGFVATVISSQTERVRREADKRVDLALDRARLAEEAQRALADAQNERTRNALLTSVSHDLRTPLAVILSAAGALQESVSPPLSPRQREHVVAVTAEARRLNRLIQNLVDVTSLESGTVRARKTWQPIEEVIGVALGRLETALGDRPVKVDIDERARFADFDATLIEQVLVNLVENAVKYAPPSKPIAIRARATADGVEVEVADAGPGVPPGQELAVFEKFHRATSAGVGMGVGLAICRGVLAAHEGRIWYEHRLGGGAIFKFSLPGLPPPSLVHAIEAAASGAR